MIDELFNAQPFASSRNHFIDIVSNTVKMTRVINLGLTHLGSSESCSAAPGQKPPVKYSNKVTFKGSFVQ